MEQPRRSVRWHHDDLVNVLVQALVDGRCCVDKSLPQQECPGDCGEHWLRVAEENARAAEKKCGTCYQYDHRNGRCLHPLTTDWQASYEGKACRYHEEDNRDK